MKIRWLGINGFEFQYNGRSILLDPYVTRRMDVICDPASVSRYISGADSIIIGHSHWDHLADTPEIARRSGACVIGSETTLNICRAMGVAPSQLRLCAAGDIINCQDFSIEVFPSRHKQPMLYPGRYDTVPEKMKTIEDFVEGGTFALLFDFGGLRILNLGSAGFIPEALDGLSCDSLLVGISGRKPDFLRELLRCISTQMVIPTHFDFFDTPLEEPGERISIAEFMSEIRLIAPDLKVKVPEPLKWFDLNKDE